MKISLNIQSYKRAGFVNTIDILPYYSLWVHNFELDEYKKIYGKNTKVLPDETRGNLPKVKNYILDQCKDDDVIVFLDDDMQSIEYWEKNERHKLKKEEIETFITKYSIVCNELGAKLWGININNDKQVYREYTPFSTVSYISSSFACFLKGNKLKYDERYPLKEDFDMYIQQCNEYRKVLRVNKYYYMKKSASNVGGCATYRNVIEEKKQLELLQKKWGKKIVKMDSLDGSRNHITKKIRKFDINPVVTVPILGV